MRRSPTYVVNFTPMKPFGTNSGRTYSRAFVRNCTQLLTRKKYPRYLPGPEINSPAAAVKTCVRKLCREK